MNHSVSTFFFLITSSTDQPLECFFFSSFKCHGIYQHRVHVDGQVEIKNKLHQHFFSQISLSVKSQCFFLCFFICYLLHFLIRLWHHSLVPFFFSSSIYPDLRLFVMICMPCKMLDWALTECVVSVFLSISRICRMHCVYVCVCKFSFKTNVWYFVRFICWNSRRCT